MKKYLLILLVSVCSTQVRAQSISLPDLVNLANLDTKQAGDNLIASKKFALISGEEVNGNVIEHYQAITNKENIIIGVYAKTGSGAVLHTVSYTSRDPQNVMNLMAQTSASGLKQYFRGSDKYNNIYLFDSYLYRVVVHLSIDNTKATIDISQKAIL